ncbi:MAG: PQQ-binding-like beta-propeller repeat protein [Acidobacteriota bacterium]
MMRALRIGVALTMMAGGSVAAADWPQWRGPFGTGATDELDLPTRWSATENIAWKSSLGGVGVSSPIVAGNLVFVTSQIGVGVSRQGPRLAQGTDSAGAERSLAKAGAGSAADKVFFLLEAFDRANGRRAWEYRIEAVGPLPSVHDKHNLASPSPVTDGQLVYAWFGTGQVVALDLSGKLVWQRHLGQENSPFDINWGHSSSPTLYQDTLILLCDHAPSSYLLAVDKKTGKDRWKADRGKGRLSYTTPFVVQAGGGPELLVNSSERVDAYDPRTGATLWHVGGSNQFPIPVPTFGNGVIYLTRGYRSGPYLAVRPGGRGDVSSSHVVWEVATGAPYISSLVYHGGLLYMASDVGAISVIDAETGRRLWQERVNGLFSASPVAGDGKIYFVSETGEVIVLRAGREPQVIARNDIGERLIAGPAISNGQIFLRSDGALFAVGKPRQ